MQSMSEALGFRACVCVGVAYRIWGSVLNRHLSAAGIRPKHIPSSCCCSSAGEVPTSPSIWTQNYMWILNSIRSWVLAKRSPKFIVPERSDLALPFLSLNSSWGKAHLSPYTLSLQSVRKTLCRVLLKMDPAPKGASMHSYLFLLC